MLCIIVKKKITVNYTVSTCFFYNERVIQISNIIVMRVLDPLIKLLMSHLCSVINIILCYVNLCFSSGVNLVLSCKSAIISHLIKK